MSTRIYNAYMLVPGVDLFDFRREVIRVLRTACEQVVAEEYMGELVGIRDRKAFGLLEEAHSPVAVARRNRIEHPAAPAVMSVGEDTETGRLLTIAHGTTGLTHEMFLGLDSVEREYDFWDNMDRPDEVTEAEWDERREAWDRVLPGIGHVASSMVQFQIHDMRPPLGLQDDAPKRSVARRAESIAADMLMRLVGERCDVDAVIRHAFDALTRAWEASPRVEPLMTPVTTAELTGAAEIPTVSEDALEGLKSTMGPLADEIC